MSTLVDRSVDLEEQQFSFDGKDGERFPITTSQRPFHSGGACPETGGRWRNCNIVLYLLVLLVGADVALRFVDGAHKSSFAFARKKPQWIPIIDVLNASGIDELKFNRNVGNFGLQGLTMSRDGTLLYEFHTLSVRVLELDVSGKVTGVTKRRLYDGPKDFPSLANNLTVSHIGGVDIAYSEDFGNEIWLATHSDGIDGKGGLFAVDAETLQVKTSRAVLHDVNLDWVAHLNGILYYGEFFNVKVVHRVSIDTLQRLPDLLLSLPDSLSQGGINYVQSAAFDLEDRLVLLGDDYQCTIYTLSPDSGQLVGSQGLLLGSESDGITFDRRRQHMLVGFNRQHSHEQVMELEPMISIIQHQRL